MLVAKSELAYYPEEVQELQEKPKKNTKKQLKKQDKKQEKIKGIFKSVALLFPIILLAISLSILFRYANISSIRRDITKLESQRTELERVKMDLVGQMESLKSSIRISEDAITKLGMDYPAEGQIVYISVNDPELSEVKESGLIKQLKKVFGAVVKIF